MASTHAHGAYTRRLRSALKSAILASAGRRIRCESCGSELFRGVPVVWAGRLRVLGSAGVLVRVDWDEKNRLAFRHVEQDTCRNSPA